jgi:hypothetical protein
VEEAKDTGILKFFSYHDNKAGFYEHVSCTMPDHASCNLGPMHYLPVSTPYITKAHTETKRSKAMALETTYAYDFPDLFKSNMVDIWKEYRAKWGQANCPPDSEICTYQELVLDEDGKKNQ